MAGQQSGTGASTELNDEKVRKEDILSNRDKTMRRPRQSLDGTGVQVDEYKDIPTNQRPEQDADPDDAENPDEADKKVDRPGFDLGGASGKTEAGKGLGLGTDAKEGRKDWGLPRKG
jgi:hypothetical protein